MGKKYKVKVEINVDLHDCINKNHAKEWIVQELRLKNWNPKITIKGV
tara:strand:- start:2389 stop:2529 length:141 start_codon:yes stop_codon:yes gene_type:complete